MTNEERDLVTRYIARVAGAQGGMQQGGGFSGGSVPQAQPALPPIDRDADALIAQLFQQYPDARYRITQTALVQEAAFAEAQNQISRLQWELEQTRHAVQNQPQQSPQQKGFFSSLFSGGQQQPQQPGYGQAFQPTSQPPQPQYPPNYQPGMFQRGGGSGFLGSALTTAAGVAGGMFVGNALMNAFSGPHTEDGAGVSPAADTSGGFLPDQGGGGFDQASSDPFGGAGGGFDQASSDPFGGGGGGDAGGGFDGGGFDQA